MPVYPPMPDNPPNCCSQRRERLCRIDRHLVLINQTYPQQDRREERDATCKYRPNAPSIRAIAFPTSTYEKQKPKEYPMRDYGHAPDKFEASFDESDGANSNENNLRRHSANHHLSDGNVLENDIAGGVRERLDDWPDSRDVLDINQRSVHRLATEWDRKPQ